MTALLIAEELFLLTHDDESGKNTDASMGAQTAMAGAVLLDLAEQGLMKIDDKKKVVVTVEQVEHPLLAEALAVIDGNKKDRPLSHWVTYLPSKIKKLQDKVGDSLVRRGVLDREKAKVLGMFTTTRWPEVDPAPERALRTGLADVLVRGVTPTDHQMLLIPLLHGMNLVPKLVEKDDRKAAKATAAELAKAAKEGQLVSTSVSQAIAATQAAVMVAVMVPAITASTGSN